MTTNWKKWALITVSAFFLFLLPETVSYAQNSTVRDSSKELIVIFKSRPTISLLSTLSSGTTQDLEVKNGITASNAMVFTVPSGDIQTAMKEIVKNPNVASVFPNYLLNLQVIPNDPLVSEAPLVGFPRSQWNLFNLNLAGTGRSAWDVTTGSPNIVVAVIDTGVDSTHPDLAGKIDSLVDCSTGTCSVVTTMTDAHAAGHGTHVAGMVGAVTNNSTGIASAGYNTKIIVIKVMDASGNTETDNFFNAIKWAADHGAKVINTSFGVVADSLPAAAIAEYNSHVAYAWNKGAVVVAAAGNCFGNTNGREGCGIFANGGTTITGYAVNSKLYPAASPNVISVAASTVDNNIASYSERNDSANANIGNWISVAAPGGDGACTDSTKTCILSTVPGASLRYFWQSGTSMASPQVAGVAALVFAAKPSLTNEQVKNIIETSANHAVLSAVTKFGLVNALAAIEAANGTVNTTPSPTPIGNSNLTPTLTIAPTSSATVSGTPTIVPTFGPTATPTVTPYPTVPPRLPKTLPNPYPQAPYCAVATSCVQKTSGDANCDGKVDETDFNLWKQEFDTMASTLPANQNATFACVEGNTQTYFVDLVSFEIWRRNTTNGLVIGPSPTPTITPVSPTRISVPPSNTPVPASGGGGGGGGANTAGGSGGVGGGGGWHDDCNNDYECSVGRSCVRGGGGNRCVPNDSVNPTDKPNSGVSCANPNQHWESKSNQCVNN